MMKKNRYEVCYCVSINPVLVRYGRFVVNASTKLGAIIRGTKICKRNRWVYLNVFKVKGVKK